MRPSINTRAGPRYIMLIILRRRAYKVDARRNDRTRRVVVGERTNYVRGYLFCARIDSWKSGIVDLTGMAAYYKNDIKATAF